MGLVCDMKAVNVREKKKRLKREEYTHVKHDKSFSDWKVLVGSSDWKDHASGKIPDRYRVSNLPGSNSGPGVYEIGVTPPAWLPSQRSNHSGSLKPQDVVVVYLGCADNVNYHLHRYGQTGAHLEGIRSARLFNAKNELGSTPKLPQLDKSRSLASESSNTSSDRAPGTDGGYTSIESYGSSDPTDEYQAKSEKKSANPSDQVGSRSPMRGPRLFSEAFALGCSIAFRWAATDSKEAAERTESKLIDVFDYAWKRGGKFRQRSPEILAKIVKRGALGSNDSHGCFGESSGRVFFVFKRRRVGVTIAARQPSDNSRPFVGSSSRGTDSSKIAAFFAYKFNPPVLVGKSAKTSEFTKLDIPVNRCGALLESGLSCSALPVKSSKRCRLHKKPSHKKPARVAHTSSPTHDSSEVLVRVTQPTEQGDRPLKRPSPESSISCFSCLSHSSQVRSNPPEPKRRGSLSFNSWLRTSELRMAKSREWAELKNPLGPRPEGTKLSATSYSNILATCEESACESSRLSTRRDICGLRLEDGTVCLDPPRPDRKRCEAHKGLRNQARPQSPNTYPLRQGMF
ncbi:uncharacterized protein [Physcomitrium patens]|uniref:GIY-YIG domain-containing protein n=1 Tax=Physcomitrium patens TaxID=3218 RepID=A0A2K1IAG3_PHYPA|nr:protein EFFECTOR OF TRANSCRIPTION 2-like [Physcomitrium patens]PNR26273.1 hypothetical protein PHYPA_030847 [Physcomitrium patens]|eukprot:XP_024367281.1 protein EFFECTOR OF TRANSCRIPTION 2-like [Physcomitrella patens]